MIFNPFDFLTTIVGYIVYWVAHKVFAVKRPGFTARNQARIAQIVAVAAVGPILSPLPLNPLSIASTAVYVLFLGTNLIIVNILVAAAKSLKVKMELLTANPSSIQIVAAIMERFSPYKLQFETLIVRIKEYIEWLKGTPLLRILLAVLNWSLYLFDLILYPYIIKPLALDLFINILNFIEYWLDWLSENVLQVVLGEIVTKLVQIFGLLTVKIPRSLLVVVRAILDYFFKK